MKRKKNNEAMNQVFNEHEPRKMTKHPKNN